MAIKPIIVKSRYDRTYPLDKVMYENMEKIIYHGTSSNYTQQIERDGWVPNAQPYDIREIQSICEIYEAYCYSTSAFAVLKGFTLGGTQGIEDKAASFTIFYWNAKDYASNPGGETVKYAVEAITELLEFLKNPEALKNHKIWLKNKISAHSSSFSREKLQSALETIEDVDFFQKTAAKLHLIQPKYVKLSKNLYPVVYAVEYNPNLFEFRNAKNDLLAKDTIPASYIRARIDFPDGVIRFPIFENCPKPLPWNSHMEDFKKYLGESNWTLKQMMGEENFREIQRFYGVM